MGNFSHGAAATPVQDQAWRGEEEEEVQESYCCSEVLSTASFACMSLHQ